MAANRNNRIKDPYLEKQIARRIFREKVQSFFTLVAWVYLACYVTLIVQRGIVEGCTCSTFTRTILPTSWCEPWQSSWNVKSGEEHQHHHDQDERVGSAVNDDELTLYARGIMTAPLELSHARGLLLTDREMALRSPHLQATPLPDLLGILADLIAQVKPEFDIFVDNLCLHMDELDSFFTIFHRNLDAYFNHLRPRPDSSWLVLVFAPWIETIRLCNMHFNSPFFPQRLPASAVYREMLYQLSLFAKRSQNTLNSDVLQLDKSFLSSFMPSANRVLSNLTAFSASHNHALGLLRANIEREQGPYWSFYQDAIGLKDLPPLRAWRSDRDTIEHASTTVNTTAQVVDQTTLIMQTLQKRLQLLSDRFRTLTMRDLHESGGSRPVRVQAAMLALEEYSLLIRGRGTPLTDPGHRWVAQRARVEREFWEGGKWRGEQREKILTPEDILAEGILQPGRPRDEL